MQRGRRGHGAGDGSRRGGLLDGRLGRDLGFHRFPGGPPPFGAHLEQRPRWRRPGDGLGRCGVLQFGGCRRLAAHRLRRVGRRLRNRRSGLLRPVAGVVRARHARQCPMPHPGHCRRDRHSFPPAVGRPRRGPVIDLPPVVAVVGPTATGKTALAVALAQRLDGEVVNADSMQLYRGMDIGTAKPTRPSAAGCRITCSTCGTCASRPRWPSTASGARARSTAPRRGRVPLLVGGSGSTSARCSTTSTSRERRRPPRPAGGRAVRVGPPRCTTGWRGSTRPPAAVSCPATDGAIVPALEVVELTGGPFHRRPARAPGRTIRPSSSASIGIRPTSTRGSPPGATACGRPGFVDEVGALADDGLREGPTASRALGYAQVLAQLDGDATDARGPRARRSAPPPVRAPAAVLVPPRCRRPPGSTPVAPTSRPRSRRLSRARTIGRDHRSRLPGAVGHGTENDFVRPPRPGRLGLAERASRPAPPPAVRSPGRHRR